MATLIHVAIGFCVGALWAHVVWLLATRKPAKDGQ